MISKSQQEKSTFFTLTPTHFPFPQGHTTQPQYINYHSNLTSILPKMMTKLPNHNLDSICKEFHDHGCRGNLTHFVKLFTKNTQLECRKMIREKYMEMYGEDLFSHLLKNTTQMGSDHGIAMFVLNQHERDAIAAREALYKQSEIKYEVLVEIYVGRKSSHFFLIQQVYQARFRRHLDQDILCIEPPHPYQKILMGLAASQKAHSSEVVSQHIANCDAQRLFQTGEGGSNSIDESVVLEIISKRSISQLRLTLSNYKRIYGHNYTKILKKSYYGEFVEALRAVAEFISNPSKCYAKALYGGIKGVTKDNRELARLMASSEVDMNEIRRVYKKKYGTELRDAIAESNLAGDYRDFLVTLATK